MLDVMNVTLNEDQLWLALSDEFLARLDSGFRDDFVLKVETGRLGNYAAVDFGPGAGSVIVALREFTAAARERIATAEQLAKQIERVL